MLKNIPNIIPPELLKILMEMGHGDQLVIGDGNFPAARLGQRLVRCDGHGVREVLDAILTLFPLDTYVETPVRLMEVVKGDPFVPTIWDEYQKIINKHEDKANKIGYLSRFDFYDAAKDAFAIVSTSESEIYANIILSKGVI